MRRQVPLPEQGDEAETVTAYCRLLTESLTRIALFDWAGEFTRIIAHHEGLLRTLTERVAPGWYAGSCRRCGTPTHVIPGITWVTCTGCGATTHAGDHRAQRGIPGILTRGLEQRVRAYQRSHQLTVDGIVGVRTQIAMLAELGLPNTPSLIKDH